MICASAVSRPIFFASNWKAPVPLTVPPKTCDPACLRHRQALAGQHRFVDLAGSLAHDAIDGHALARTNDDDVAHANLSQRNFLLAASFGRSRITRAVDGCRFIRCRMASEALPVARDSSIRPSRIKTTITAAASK